MMMEFSDLMELIGVKLTPFEIKPGITVYIRLPSLKHNAECSDPFKAIFYCVVDKEGNQIFESTELIENKIDMMIQLKLSAEINRIFDEAFQEETVEKK